MIKKKKSTAFSTKEYRKSGRERKIYVSRGRRKKNKTHNTEGVKFQRALVVQSHIPATGMCGQGVWGRHAISALWATPQQLTEEEGWRRGAGQRGGGECEDRVSPICWETVCLSSMIKENQKLVRTCCGARNCPCTGTCGQGRLWRCPPPSWSTATLSPGWTSGCLPTLQREETEREQQICWKWGEDEERERGGKIEGGKNKWG